MLVEVYADVWCPFAHLSLRRLGPLRDELAPGVPLVVRAWPLELVNGRPLDPGQTAAHVAELRRDVAPGLFAGFDPTTMPASTLEALALVEAVNDLDPSLGERISLDLRDALFERGERIDTALLADLARRAGLDASVLADHAAVLARLAEGRRRGVQGSPHLFIGGRGLFCPLLDIERDEAGDLHMRERMGRFETFVREGLAR